MQSHGSSRPCLSVDYELRYVREDLESEYSQDSLDQAYQSVMANQVSTADFSQVGSLGDIEAQLFILEEVVVFLFPASRYEGVFASYDRKDPFPIFEVIGAASDLDPVADKD